MNVFAVVLPSGGMIRPCSMRIEPSSFSVIVGSVDVTAEPQFTRVYKWKGAMAQYSVGHLERLDRIDRLRRQLPGLALAGNGYRGIGVPDCVRSGSDAADALLVSFGLTPIPTQVQQSA